jgi:hypothetical protein
MDFVELASEDMPELPLDIMNIPCNKLLCWRLLCEILQTTLYHLLFATANQTTHAAELNKRNATQNTHSSHQWGEDTLGRATGHREPAVRAGVARSQRLAEVIRRLLAHDSHLRRQVRVVLLLLHTQRGKGTQPTQHKKSTKQRRRRRRRRSIKNPGCLTGLSGCSVICAYTSSVSTSACMYIYIRAV